MLVLLWGTTVLLVNCASWYFVESNVFILVFGEGVITHKSQSCGSFISFDLGLYYFDQVPSPENSFSHNFNFVSKTCETYFIHCIY
jgi:hypothetical protein